MLINAVAPFAGAWIEIPTVSPVGTATFVAPFAGAWIEIPVGTATFPENVSLPSRERGLK